MLYTDTEAHIIYHGDQGWRGAHWHRQRQENDKLHEQGGGRRYHAAEDGIVIHRHVRDSDCNYHLYDERENVNMVENIRRIGIFMIAAQTVMHFAAGKQYEKYMKIVTGVIVLLLFIGPFTASSGNLGVDWQTEIERMERQMQSDIHLDISNMADSVETAALRQMEQEIKRRLNDAISDRDCTVTDVVLDLEEIGGKSDEKGTQKVRNWELEPISF